jgi:8-oxo-dGTP diphosphatase
MARQLIHVVRHAHAGDPAAWRHNDDLRPLSEKGCGQAERLVGHLGERPAAVVSSPSVRCIATVLPLARAHRLPVSTLEELHEGNSAAAMLHALATLGAAPLVACTHGDLLADLLGVIVAAGVELPTARTEKGSTWTLELEDGRVSSARYLPPP